MIGHIYHGASLTPPDLGEPEVEENTMESIKYDLVTGRQGDGFLSSFPYSDHVIESNGKRS